MRPMRTRSPLPPPAEGERVRVLKNTNSHSYTTGQVYVVTGEVNPEGAFRARDEQTGDVGNWLTHSEVEVIPRIGWEWLRDILPRQDVRFLEAFEGIHSLTLKPTIKDTILADLDALDEAILAAVSKREPEGPGRAR